jgi:heme-dependent oxidative N-demethylase alpha subunit-like protein
MKEILQKTLPYDTSQMAALPGVRPLDPADMWIRDDAFAGQMRERDRLVHTAHADVVALDPLAEAAAQELLEIVLRDAYAAEADSPTVLRPDGRIVEIKRSDPMGTLGRLVQEDLCILQKQGDEHVLTGAVLCFPASWTLAEKFNRPLIGIHAPVDSYDERIATRVQRLFDGVQTGRPLWRWNALWYDDPTLHQLRSETDRRDFPEAGRGRYLRSERQAIFRLPETRAVVFSIHTFMLAKRDAPAMQGA